MKIKKLIKTFIISFVFVAASVLFMQNNRVLCAPDSISTDRYDEYMAELTNTLGNREALFSLKIDYTLDYETRYTKAESDKINIYNETENDYLTEYEYDTVYYSKKDYFSFKFIRNDSIDDKVYFDSTTNSLRIPYAPNGNGCKIVFNTINASLRGILATYALNNSSYNKLSILAPNSMNLNPIDTNDGNQYYLYMGMNDYFDISLQNDSNGYSYISALTLPVYTPTKTNITASINKDNNKNLCSMQIVARYNINEYSTIHDNLYDTYVYFGMMYGKADSITDEEITTCINCLKNNTTNTCSDIKLIPETIAVKHELYYANTNKYYDETGFNVVNYSEASYMQVGVSINNISDSNLNTEILAIPYMRILEAGTYRVICFKPKQYSVKSLAAIYSNMDSINELDKLFLSEIAK